MIMNLRIILKNPIFYGIKEEDLEELMVFLEARRERYAKGSRILRMGDTTERMGIVLSGGVNILRTDLWGRQSILDHVALGEVFGETYACLGGEPLMVDAEAAAETEILFLRIRKLMTEEWGNGKKEKEMPSGEHARRRLLQNMLYIMTGKNLNLARKINHITPKSIRGRIESYLSGEALRRKSAEFDIPFSRQQMADYLLVDRSALSAELSRMQKEGLLTYRKNHFCLHPEFRNADE